MLCLLFQKNEMKSLVWRYDHEGGGKWQAEYAELYLNNVDVRWDGDIRAPTCKEKKYGCV